MQKKINVMAKAGAETNLDNTKPDGPECIIATKKYWKQKQALREGDVFGEVGFLTGRPRTAAVIADGPVEVYEIGRLDIEKLIETNPEVIARIEDFYETRVRDTIRILKS